MVAASDRVPTEDGVGVALTRTLDDGAAADADTPLLGVSAYDPI